MTDPIRRAQRLTAVRMHEDRGPDSLEANLRRMISDFGLWGYHTRNSIGSQRGWPDWVILGPGGALFRELKSERGQPTPDQRRVGSMLAHAGLDWAVWRPRDYLDGSIQRQLSGIAAVQCCAPSPWRPTALPSPGRSAGVSTLTQTADNLHPRLGKD